MPALRRLLAVVPGLDERPAALLLAGQLARASGAELTLVDALPARSPGGRARLERASRARLQRLAEASDAERVERLLLPDDDPARLVRVVGAVRPDLVLKTAYAEGPLAFGALGFTLLRDCRRPVLVLQPGAAPPGRLLAALDPGERVAARSLARRVASLSLQVAGWLHAEVELLHACPIPGQRLLSQRLPREVYARFVEHVRARARQRLDSFQRDCWPKGPAARIDLSLGEPVATVLAEAGRRCSDLLVLGRSSHTRAGAPPLGPTTERLVGAARCSLLLVGP